MTRLLNMHEVMRLTTLSRGSVYNLMNRGKFPRPVKLGLSHRIAWRDEDVLAWIDNRGSTVPSSPKHKD